MSILLQLISSILILISATVFDIDNATFQSVYIGIRITDINIKYQYRYRCQYLSSLSIDIDADICQYQYPCLQLSIDIAANDAVDHYQ